MADQTVALAVFYVYALLLADGSTPFYIGKGKGRRWLHHECPCNLRGNSHRSNIIKKLLREIGVVPKIKIAEGLTEADAHALEIKLIAIFGRRPNGLLVNKTDGGEGVVDQTGDIGRKISAARIGHQVSDETRAILRAHRLGSKASAETKAKQSIAMTGKARTPEHNEKLAATKRGKKRPPHVGEAVRRAHLGKKLSPEQIAKAAAGHRGLRRSAETVALMSAARSAWWKRRRVAMAAYRAAEPPAPEQLSVQLELPLPPG